MTLPNDLHLEALGVPHVGTVLAVGVSRWALRGYGTPRALGFTVVAVEVDQHHRAIRGQLDGSVYVDATMPTAHEFYDEAHEWLEAVARARGWLWALRAQGAA